MICYFSPCGLLRIQVCNFGLRAWDLSIMILARVSSPRPFHLLVMTTYRTFLTGSFFGGSAQTIKWWRSIYFNYHDRYLSREVFVGKDQTLINALFLLNPRRIISV